MTSKDTQILSQLSIPEIIERDFFSVRSGSTLRTLTEVIGKSKRNIFPVLDQDDNLLGVISLEDIRETMFNTSLYDTIVVDKLMRAPGATVDVLEDMGVVMEKFDKAGVWNIPVLSSGK